MRHNHFAANSACIVNSFTVAKKHGKNAVHFPRVCSNIVSDRTVSARYGTAQKSVFVLKFKRSAVKLIFHKIFRIRMFFCPGKKLLRVGGFFLASHRHNVPDFLKITGISTDGMKNSVVRIKRF